MTDEMTDEELLCQLERLEKIYLQHHSHEAAQTIREAISRLQPKPPVPGAVTVQVVVARGLCDGKNAVWVEPIDGFTSQGRALSNICSFHPDAGDSVQVTHPPVIANVTLPLQPVPVVEAEVEG